MIHVFFFLYLSICRHKINKTVCETEEEKQEVVKNMKNIDKKLNEMQEQKSADKEEMDALNK